MEAITASCPGKVLVVGGYLVLQDGMPGLVISTTSRFFSTLECISDCDRGEASADSNQGSNSAASRNTTHPRVGVEVLSPQFGAAWHYALPCDAPFVLLPPSDGSSGNPYVAHAVDCSLAAASASIGAEALSSLLRDM